MSGCSCEDWDATYSVRGKKFFWKCGQCGKSIQRNEGETFYHYEYGVISDNLIVIDIDDVPWANPGSLDDDIRPDPKRVRGSDGHLYEIHYYHDGCPVVADRV